LWISLRVGLSVSLSKRLWPGLFSSAAVSASSDIIGTCRQHMDAFALEVLEDAKSWNWPIVKRIEQSGNQGKTLVLNLLSCLIKESQAVGGTVLEQFWETIGKCDNKLKDNIKNVTAVPPGQASTTLFAWVIKEDVHLDPLFDMAAEYFAHLAVAFVNPGGPKSARHPQLSSVMVHDTDTLKCLATFAGEEARDLVLKHVNSLGNVANFESNTHGKYDELRWGIRKVTPPKYYCVIVPQTVSRIQAFFSSGTHWRSSPAFIAGIFWQTPPPGHSSASFGSWLGLTMSTFNLSSTHHNLHTTSNTLLGAYIGQNFKTETNALREMKGLNFDS
ncbi:uncharacterized protein LACBIDRAFT_331683, partial [Laccaria bicolor S238N-H82]